MNKLTFLQAALIWAGGFDHKTAKQCTSAEITKMTVAGSMVLVPPLVALFSYSYAFFLLSKASIEAALIGGSVAALVLFAIDRSIMAFGRPGVFSLGMAGRVLLAVVVSFLLAEPVLLWAFRDSIEERQSTDIANTKRSEIAPFEVDIANVRAELLPIERRLQSLQEAYTQEMDGTGGSKEKYKGPLYRQKHADYLTYKKKVDAKEAEIAGRVSLLEHNKMKRIEEVVASQANGLLGRMRTLSALANDPKNTEVWWAVWLLRAGLVLIELLPLMFKLSKSGDKQLYYVLVDQFDSERKQVVVGQATHRMTLQMKEADFQLQTDLARVRSKEQAMLMNAVSNDMMFYMDRMMAMAEKKINFKQRAAKRFRNDDEILTQAYRDIDVIYARFLRNVQDLQQRPDRNFLPDNI